MRILFAALAVTAMLPMASLAADRSGELHIFKTQFFEKDRSYAPAAREAAESILSELERNAPALTDAEFFLALAEIAALADNGHTFVSPAFVPGKFNRLPLKFVVLGDLLYVGYADDEALEGLVGARVEKIAGRSWPKVRRRLARYQGGLDGWRTQFVHLYLESPEVMHAAGLSPEEDSLTLSGLSVSGARFKKTIGARRDLPPLEGFETIIPPPRLIEISRDSPTGDADLPLYLQAPSKPFRYERIDIGGVKDVAYIQFRANLGEADGVDVPQFAARVRESLEADPPSAIVLDQRFNFGGNLDHTRELMRALPELAQGNVFVITSGRTFSAGITSVAYVKQAGGERIVIVGEPVGDRLEFWSESPFVELPLTGATLLYGAKRHNYISGCDDSDCHPSNRMHPIRIETLAPDYLAPMTYESWAARLDPAMETIERLLATP